MTSSVAINIDETERLLPCNNEIDTLWTAQLVQTSVFDQCIGNQAALRNDTVTVTVLPIYLKEGNSYKQVPKSQFCNTQQIRLTKRNSLQITSQDELSRISLEERLDISLYIEKKNRIWRCVLIYEENDPCGEYLYVFPPTLNVDKLREIVNRRCENVLQRMLLLSTAGIVYEEFEALQNLYNYCENIPLLNSKPSMIGDIALLTALELVGVSKTNIPPENSTVSSFDNLKNRLIETLVPYIQSKYRSRSSPKETLHKILGNNRSILMAYTELD